MHASTNGATRGQAGRPTTEMVISAQAAKDNPLAALDLAMTKAAPRLAEIVPRHVDPQRVIQLAMSCARRDPKILACTTSSVLIATSQIAALGLEPGTALQQAYLVPRKNRKKVGGQWEEVHEATAIIGYRGFVLLAHDSEGIDVQADVVHKLDVFRERGGLSPILEHEQSELEDPGPLRGAYAVWELASGKRRHLWWPIARLIEHRERFAQKNREGEFTGPWKEHLGAMCTKTVVRAAAKLWPLSSDRMRHALRVDDAGETGRAALSFVPGAKPEAVRDLALSMGEPRETFDGMQEYEEPAPESGPGASEGQDERQPGDDG